jgi:hypothetical protein
MKKDLAKEIFGVPALATVDAIDDADTLNAFASAHYRLVTKMRELEMQFDAKARELRAEFVAEAARLTCGAGQ